MFASSRLKKAILTTIPYAASMIGGVLLLVYLIKNGSALSHLYFHGALFRAALILTGCGIATSLVLSVLNRNAAPAARPLPGGHLPSAVTHGVFILAAFGIGVANTIFGILLLTNASFLSGVSLLFSGIFLIPGGLFPLLGDGRSPRPLPATLCGLSLVLSCVLYALFLYFDTETPKNVTMKLILTVIFLFAALFFLGEIRRILGKKISLFYRSASIIAGHLCAALSPVFLKIVTGDIALIGGLPAYLFVTVSFLYIILRVIVPTFLPEIESATPDTIPTTQDGDAE